MYKVIYQKNDGKVLGIYPFESKTEITYVFKDGEIEFEIPESEAVNYESSKLEKIEKQVESAKFFYNKEICEAVDVESIPEIEKNQYLIYENDGLSVKTDNAPLIAELKQKLSTTDYKAIKYAEGLISEEEYAPIKAERQAWRDEINQLESEV